jgi:hypothetical protein
MIRDGLYKVSFRTPLGEGSGVLYANKGQLHGGDSMMFYVGNVEPTGEGGAFKATVQVETHSQQAGMASVLGVPRATLTLTGKAVGDEFDATGTAPEARGVSFTARLRRLRD